MKYIYVILLLFIQNAFSQDSESPNKLIFEYNVGHSSWGKSGVYAKTERIEFSQTESGDYKLLQYLEIKSKAQGKVFTKDTIILNKIITVSQIKINDLFYALNTNENNYTTSFIVPKLKKPNRQFILKIAKRNDTKWKIKNDYLDKEDRDKMFSSIQSFDAFEEFINNHKPNVNTFIRTSDAWNYIQISIVKDKKTFSYTSRLFGDLGQPISIDNDTQIINLEVNLKIREILSETSLIHKAVDLNKITEKYISWYLESKI